ncbi:hypothetical protein NC652_021781 [Populus alba x Populus x berolinensis]|nr:hypothetical protein NC652_021781 [Populus alba x Populus x berolinensis]
MTTWIMLDGQVDRTVTRTLAALGPRLAEFDTEEKRLSTWGTGALDDLVLDLKHLTEALKKVTVDEEIEAYRMKKIHRDDPKKDFFTTGFIVIRLYLQVTVDEEIEAYRMKKVHRDDPVTVDKEIEAYRMKKIHRDDPVTVEEIEAYQMKKIHRDDPTHRALLGSKFYSRNFHHHEARACFVFQLVAVILKCLIGIVGNELQISEHCFKL